MSRGVVRMWVMHLTQMLALLCIARADTESNLLFQYSGQNARLSPCAFVPVSGISVGSTLLPRNSCHPQATFFG